MDDVSEAPLKRAEKKGGSQEINYLIYISSDVPQFHTTEQFINVLSIVAKI